MATTKTSNREEEKVGSDNELPKEVKQDEEVVVGAVIEPSTGISFPVKLEGGMQLNCVGLRKKSMLGIGMKIYAFGMYADNEKLKDLLRSSFDESPAEPTNEMYQKVIDSDVGMVVRLVIVFPALSMSKVKKNFDEGLGGSIKKLNGGKKNDELTNMVLGEASDSIKLPSGSVIEISRLPGYTLQTKVKGQVVSKVESELLCRSYINMYLGEDAYDKDAKEKFGRSMLALI